MPVTVILHNETSITNIANRLYAHLPAVSRNIAENALLNLNPILLDTNALKPGVIIKLPEIPSFVLNTQQINDDPTTQTKDLIKNAIDTYLVQLHGRINTQQVDLQSQTDLLNSVGEFSSQENLQLSIKTLKKSVAASLGDAKVLSDNLNQVFTQISADLSNY